MPTRVVFLARVLYPLCAEIEWTTCLVYFFFQVNNFVIFEGFFAHQHRKFPYLVLV